MVSFHGVACCCSSAFSEVKGSEWNISISTAMVPVSRNSAVGREEVKFSEKTGSFAPLPIPQRSQSLHPHGELPGYTELIMMVSIF